MKIAIILLLFGASISGCMGDMSGLNFGRNSPSHSSDSIRVSYELMDSTFIYHPAVATIYLKQYNWPVLVQDNHLWIDRGGIEMDDIPIDTGTFNVGNGLSNCSMDWNGESLVGTLTITSATPHSEAGTFDCREDNSLQLPVSGIYYVTF